MISREELDKIPLSLFIAQIHKRSKVDWESEEDPLLVREYDHIIYRFPNEYGASVIPEANPLLFSGGKWELAVLKDGAVCYGTPITEDTLRGLTDAELEETLKRIRAL